MIYLMEIQDTTQNFKPVSISPMLNLNLHYHLISILSLPTYSHSISLSTISFPLSLSPLISQSHSPSTWSHPISPFLPLPLFLLPLYPLSQCFSCQPLSHSLQLSLSQRSFFFTLCQPLISLILCILPGFKMDLSTFLFLSQMSSFPPISLPIYSISQLFSHFQPLSNCLFCSSLLLNIAINRLQCSPINKYIHDKAITQLFRSTNCSAIA